MNRPRFPKQKFLRQVEGMRDELAKWEKCYGDMYRSEPNEYVALRFAQREVGLKDAVTYLLRVEELVRELPRTSL